MTDYQSKYPRGNGALFINQRKQKETHPDFEGNVELTPEQVKALIHMIKSNHPVKLQLKGWNKTAPSGLQYISMATEAYYPDDQPAQYPPQTQAPQPGFPQAQAPVQQAPVQQAPQQAPQPANDFDQDIIPF